MRDQPYVPAEAPAGEAPHPARLRCGVAESDPRPDGMIRSVAQKLRRLDAAEPAERAVGPLRSDQHVDRRLDLCAGEVGEADMAVAAWRRRTDAGRRCRPARPYLRRCRSARGCRRWPDEAFACSHEVMRVEPDDGGDRIPSRQSALRPVQDSARLRSAGQHRADQDVVIDVVHTHATFGLQREIGDVRADTAFKRGHAVATGAGSLLQDDVGAVPTSTTLFRDCSPAPRPKPR